ncbi:hypothetical protein C8R44DRAFT_764491 [Mycena epipterygia]|nr:hypothetical protein C8R44DRAFT_764491 [Mycena epipterygia]
MMPVGGRRGTSRMALGILVVVRCWDAGMLVVGYVCEDPVDQMHHEENKIREILKKEMKVKVAPGGVRIVDVELGKRWPWILLVDDA